MVLEFPALDSKLYWLYKTLTLFSFAILMAGLIKKVSDEEISATAMIKTLVTVMLLVLIIANGKFVFDRANKFFWDIAEGIQSGYAEEPFASAATFLESTEDKKKNLIQSLFEAGIYQCIVLGIGKLLVKILSLLQVVLLAVQYFLVRLAYIAVPVVLPFFMFQSMSQVAMQFVIQTLTIMAWPVGFAVANVMADKMLDGFSLSNPTGSENVNFKELATIAGSFLTTFIAVLVSGVGTILTPVITYQLFAAGGGLVESVGTALSKGKSAAMLVGSGGMGLVGGTFALADKLAYKEVRLGGGMKTGVGSGSVGQSRGKETQSDWMSFYNPKEVRIKPRKDFSKQTGDLSQEAKQAMRRNRTESNTSDV